STKGMTCFNCQWEGHMARKCPNPKRKRDATWFKDKVLLVEAQVFGNILNEEELDFWQSQELQKVQLHRRSLHTMQQVDDLDAYDSDYDDFTTAKANLMANLSCNNLYFRSFYNVT
nr:hypothetical protein [Tanacetum cinerariifolium]